MMIIAIKLHESITLFLVFALNFSCFLSLYSEYNDRSFDWLALELILIKNNYVNI